MSVFRLGYLPLFLAVLTIAALVGPPPSLLIAADPPPECGPGPWVNVVTGTSGDDVITVPIAGYPAGSYLVLGMGGNDTITAGDEDDCIVTDAGNDNIDAGGGNNVILAGDGDNAVTTGPGNDKVVTGAGTDAILDGGGTNTIAAGAGPANNVVIFDGGGVISAGGSAGSFNAVTIQNGGITNVTLGAGAGNAVAITGNVSTVVQSSADANLVALQGGASSITLSGGVQNNVDVAFNVSTVIQSNGAQFNNVTIVGGTSDITLGAGVENNVVINANVDTVIQSSAVNSNSIALIGGTARITTSGTLDDTVAVDSAEADVHIGGAQFANVNMTNGNGNVVIGGPTSQFVNVNAVGGTFGVTVNGGPATQTQVTVLGTARLIQSLFGYNAINLNGAGTIITGPGNDDILATNGAHTIIAGDGNNTINTIDAEGANNTIVAGDGNNTIAAGDGDDTITTGSGDDNIDAGGGTDACNPGTGTDSVANCELPLAADSTPPIVAVTSVSTAAHGLMPAQTLSVFPASVGSPSATLTGTVSDDTGVAAVTVNGTAANLSPGAWSLANVVLAAGPNVLNVAATDTAGNTSNASVTVTLNLDLDGDGIADAVDGSCAGVAGFADAANNAFSDLLSGGSTCTTLLARNGHTITVTDAAIPGLGLNIVVAGGGADVQIQLQGKISTIELAAGTYVVTDPAATSSVTVTSGGPAKVTMTLAGVAVSLVVESGGTATYTETLDGGGHLVGLELGAVSAGVTVNGAPVSPGQTVSPPANHEANETLFLHATPSTLTLNQVAPIATAPQTRDSAGVNFAGANPWKEVGTWGANANQTSGLLVALDDFHVWLGLKNSDDQGTQFDIKAEVYKNGTQLVATGLTRCVTGLTRNANLAQDVLVPFPTFTAMPFNGSSDTLTLKISTRVGTNENGTKCSGPGGSHTSATGLRVYLDAVSRASRLRATLQTP